MSVVGPGWESASRCRRNVSIANIRGFRPRRYDIFCAAPAQLFFSRGIICRLRSNTAWRARAAPMMRLRAERSASSLPAHRLRLEQSLRDHLNQPAFEHLAARGQRKALQLDEKLR